MNRIRFVIRISAVKSLLFIHLRVLLMLYFIDTNCNPSFFGGYNSTEGASDMGRVVLGVDWKSIVSLVIFLACVLYARCVVQFLAYFFL